MNEIATPNTNVNGFDVLAIRDVVEQLASDPSLAKVGFRVHSRWRGTARVESTIDAYELGGQTIARKHVVRSDEPHELLGEDTGPNPQELLFAALNACMIYGYATSAAVMGITIRRLAIETEGSLDMRGALGLADVPPGMPGIRYVVRIQADATPAQLEELHQTVMARSPNRYHVANAIPLEAKLVVE